MLVVDAARRLADHGLVTGTAGNISARAGDLVAVTPTGAVLEELVPEQVVVVDLEGELVDGELEPTSELELHLGVYHRYDAGAVIHAHPPMATALACVLDELPVIHYEMLAFGGAVRVAPYHTFGTPRLAEATLNALADRNVALMANHGAIAFAADVNLAVRHMLLLEWACTVYWRAATIGTPKVLDSEQQHEVIKAAVERGYGTTHNVGG
jgi:L-fuculose-phosphate aldolase